MDEAVDVDGNSITILSANSVDEQVILHHNASIASIIASLEFLNQFHKHLVLKLVLVEVVFLMHTIAKFKPPQQLVMM